MTGPITCQGPYSTPFQKEFSARKLFTGNTKMSIEFFNLRRTIL
jgi:hypothetical protein